MADNKYQKLIDIIKEQLLGQLTEEDFVAESAEELLRKKIELFFSDFMQKHKGEWAITAHERASVLNQVAADILGLGHVEKLIHDPTISEIMINGHKQIYIERNGKLELSDMAFKDEQQLQYFVEKTLSSVGRHVNESEPYVDARLFDGSRVNVVRRPVSLVGTIVTIRKFSRKVLSFKELIDGDSITQSAAEFLSACTKVKANIIIAGGSGAGKTTMLNVLSNHIPEDERIIVIEDTAELQPSGKHVLRLETRPPSIEGKGEITIRDLMKNALHMRPDRIIVGEVRSSEVLDMLQAMTTGHEGSMTTLHSNSALEALDRLEMLALMDNPNIAPSVARRQIVSAVDIVVYMARLVDGRRRVLQIAEMSKDKRDEFTLVDIFSRSDDFRELKFSGHVPKIYDKLKQSGFKLDLFESH